MSALANSVFSRIRSGVLRSSLLSRSAEWISNNTYREGKKFSFKDHEYQIQIANETRPIVCSKCAQVGMSELQVRKALSFVAVVRDKNCIYVLPSARFASKFAKARIDPVIQRSQYLKQLLVAGVNNSELKQIDSSFLYISGASNSSQAISVPADYVIFDEYDFCNMGVIGDYESRLGHADNGGNSSRFSTPTVPGFGVSKEIKQTGWARYLVKCPHCYKEVAPIFSQHVRIPGFDRPFDEFNRDVLESGQYQIDAAYIACPRCAGPLDSSFGDATRRRWVEQFVGRDVAGYDIRPFDLIKYNPTVRTLRRFTKFKRRQSYYNFALGESYAGKDTEIQPSIVEANTVLSFGEMPTSRPLQMGVDVGLTSHVVVGEEVDGKTHVYRVHKLYQSDGDLNKQIQDLALLYGIDVGVIDAQPEKNVSFGIRRTYMMGEFWPAYYVDKFNKDFDFFILNEDKGHVSIVRNDACEDFVNEVNSGLWKWTDCAEMESVKFQLTQMKKIASVNEELEDLEDADQEWAKISETDHYFHACVYLKTAIAIANHDTLGFSPVAPLSIHSVKVKQEVEQDVSTRLVSILRR